MDGILAVWKPEGWTSHDVVAKLRRLLGMKRIGHAGTLDPMVTGVLPVCLGRATRVVEYVQERPKAYEAVLKLGIATDTEDLTGTILESVSVPPMSESDIAAALQSFRGTISQVPPMFSAVKVNGKRLYELAREGKTVERKAREATIYDIRLLRADLNREQPEIEFAVQCSKGTYIRTLCVDIGKALGVPATMAGLTRTISAGITKESCLTMEQIQELAASGEIERRLIPADQAVSHLSMAEVETFKETDALRGQKIALRFVSAEGKPPAFESGELVRLYGRHAGFIGIYEADAELAALKPVKVFS